MKLTNRGYRISKNGRVLNSIEEGAIQENVFKGNSFKKEGTYFFFERMQGDTFIYLT